MKVINRIDAIRVFLAFAFVLVVACTTQPCMAKDREKIPDDLSVHGKWNVTYVDNSKSQPYKIIA